MWYYRNCLKYVERRQGLYVIRKALGYLEKAGYREHVIQLGESTATVAMAAEALGVEPGRIAKTMSFFRATRQY